LARRSRLHAGHVAPAVNAAALSFEGWGFWLGGLLLGCLALMFDNFIWLIAVLCAE
jgi:hypothetical protein